MMNNDGKTRRLSRTGEQDTPPPSHKVPSNKALFGTTGKSINIGPLERAPNDLGLHSSPVAAPVQPDAKGNTLQQSADNATISIHTRSFTTGWVVALSGPLKGRSFNLHVGNNLIGRSSQNHICLAGDQGISSQAIIITYDATHRNFFIQKGDRASQIAYVDNMPLLSRKLLALNTLIQLSPDVGETEGTKLKFIPFCSDQFSWDENNSEHSQAL